ncbi:hypothetical protein CDAR_299611 [Caerostris darwini]|uniref:Uncharacterized protein n=1 Tax=Caerostris darwini TaxID=1538125 RepID=A0AAV4RQI9_9ARAC|nr:hypothetical protein CDAR_299611 [Caerostris darwini]
MPRALQILMDISNIGSKRSSSFRDKKGRGWRESSTDIRSFEHPFLRFPPDQFSLTSVEMFEFGERLVNRAVSSLRSNLCRPLFRLSLQRHFLQFLHSLGV